ncbi:hypothetical protein M427DRAFT_138811 [Gonapodya prolifera JEL478]|uniref:VPS37 C-terminal domain-containing protein n=1 Tax=Gonapodya prolifera (strain JEL478) TaxID=1344416 RepID=A0A139A2I8_GONPJ|nr:hypothetical protein M427DRAFT_138811 [Gonapodya prolifera JEL478]|eukprot:KXS10909.1 hypothetical protein M427DRAFT_138811 [Gonapodya prolifera JEL478]
MATPLQQKRHDQVQSLLSELPHVRTLAPYERYEIPFTLPPPLNTRFSMLLTLPPDFPNVRPSLKFLQSVQHPVVADDGRQVMGKPQLGALWNINQNLGRIVRDLVDEFQRNPPLPLDLAPMDANGNGSNTNGNGAGAGTGNQRMPYANGDGYGQGMGRQVARGHANENNPYPSQPPPQQQQPVSAMTADLAKDLAVLNQMSDQELQELVDDESAFTEFFETLPKVVAIRHSQDAQMDQIENLARTTLALEETLQGKQASLRAALTQMDAAKEETHEKLVQQRQQLLNFSPQNLIQALTREVEDADKDSRDVIQSMYNPSHGDERLTFDEFVAQYREARKLYHVRRAKLELIQRQVR